MKSILFLTSTNLAANPRLLKELKLATANGFSATVIQFSVGNWSDAMTAELQQQFSGVEFINLSALRKPFIPWLLSTLFQILCNIVPVSAGNNRMLSIRAGKRSYLLLQQLKKIQKNHDWVIAHNPAAFYPACLYGRQTGAKIGIDVEDYHPGETNDGKASITMKKLMQAVMPFATYCSYAAPLIAAEVQQDIPGMKSRQLTILNGFIGTEFHPPTDHGRNGLQLIWFSQNIDAGRGLEHLIPVVNELYPAIELHLIGNLKQDFANQYLQNRTGIHIHAPMPQDKLHAFLSNCEIGLATDIPVNRNRDIALTNKIIAYAQAGLYIIAFKTEGQQNFLVNSDLQYQVIENNKDDIRKALHNLNQLAIKKGKAERFIKGSVYDWNRFGKPLLEVWGG